MALPSRPDCAGLRRLLFAFSITSPSPAWRCWACSPSPAFAARAQAPLTPEQLHRWQHLDLQADGVPGISADRAYRELLAGRPATPVLVAVIDSGIDSTHEDLKPILWRNMRETAGNGLDDDHNGYADDVRGWSFLGNADSRNIVVETLEQTRIYARYRTQFEGKSRKQVPAGERENVRRVSARQGCL